MGETHDSLFPILEYVVLKCVRWKSSQTGRVQKHVDKLRKHSQPISTQRDHHHKKSCKLAKIEIQRLGHCVREQCVNMVGSVGGAN